MWLAVKAFMLLILAVGGTVITFTSNPVEKIYYTMVGKTHAELDAAVENFMRTPNGDVNAQEGCFLYSRIAFMCAYLFLITPLVTLGAILNGTGDVRIAYVVLLIVLASWIDSYMQFKKLQKNKLTKTPDSIVEAPSRSVRSLKKMFLSIPELYLWYVFLVVIGILK